MLIYTFLENTFKVVYLLKNRRNDNFIVQDIAGLIVMVKKKEHFKYTKRLTCLELLICNPWSWCLLYRPCLRHHARMQAQYYDNYLG